MLLSGCRFSCNVPPVQGRDRLFWHAEDIGVVVRDKRYKLWHHGNGLRALFDLDRDPSESVNLWDSEEARAVAAKRRLLEVRRTLPEGDVYVRTGPLTPDYGLYSHWRLDRPVAGAAGRPTFADSVGGFHAEAGEAPMVAPGKLGNAPRTGSLHVARFSQFFRIRPSDLSSLTLSAWIRRDEGSTDEVTLLRLRKTPDEERSPLSLVGKTDGSIAVRHWGRGMSATPTGASDDGWIHVAFAWGSVAGGQEAVLYLDGEAKIRSTEFIPTPRSRSALPPGGWLEIGDDGVVVDDVAVWRQALTPAQIAALHLLGNDYGYDAAEVDTLFNVPREHAVQVGGRRWERMAAPADADGLRIADTPEGVVELDFGGGMAIRSTPSGAAAQR